MTTLVDLAGPPQDAGHLAALVDRLRQEGEGLRSALRGTAAMQQAIGIVMERHAVDAREAFERLLTVATQSQRTIPEVADDLVAARTGRYGQSVLVPAVSVTHGDGDERAGLQSAFQQCAVALPMTLTLEHVADVVAATGLQPLGPCRVALYRLDDDGWLARVAASPHDWLNEWPRIPLDERLPVSIAGHHGRAVWLTSPAQWDEQFGEFHVSGARSVACLPMHRNGQVVGTVVVGWSDSPDLDESARRHTLAIADLAAETLHRISTAADEGAAATHGSREPATALVEVGLHPTALVRPVREVGGDIVDFEIAWVVAPDDDPALESLAGSRVMERFPGLHGTDVERILHEVSTTGRRMRREDILLSGLLPHGRPIRLTVTVTPFVDGLLVAWASHEQEDERLAVVTDELMARREQATRDRQAIEVMQRSALPDEEFTQVEGVDIVARYLPVLGDPLGGDWYDVFAHEGLVWLAVGDVAGHGVAAAAHMSQLRNAARGLIVSGADPAQICVALNRLALTFHSGTTATCIIGVLDPARRLWSWSNAGHPAPVLIGPGRSHRPLISPAGLLLGVSDDATYGIAREQLTPETTLLLMTDGMFERPGEPVDAGIRRLLRNLPTGDVRELGDRIAHGLPPEHRDDACFLIARCQADIAVA